MSKHRIRLSTLGSDVVARVASKREVVRAFLGQVLGVDDDTARVQIADATRRAQSLLGRAFGHDGSDPTLYDLIVNSARQPTLKSPLSSPALLVKNVFLETSGM